MSSHEMLLFVIHVVESCKLQLKTRNLLSASSISMIRRAGSTWSFVYENLLPSVMKYRSTI